MTDRPNILWFCTDQQRFDTIGALGNPDVHTPALDRLVAEGVSFDRTYCQNPICTPSRASFLTGRYPSAIGVHRNGNESFPKSAESLLVTRLLADHGYDCGLVGKLHLSSCASRPEPRGNDGFRYFKWSHSPRNLWESRHHDYAAWLLDKGYDPEGVLSLRHKRKDRAMAPSSVVDNVPPEQHHLTWASQRGMEFMDDAKEPWLLCMNTFEPHPPFNPPWEYYRRFDPDSLPGPHFRDQDLETQSRLSACGIDFQTNAQHPDVIAAREIQASYYAMIEQIDHAVGNLLEYLRDSGKMENTIVVFMSDHGEMLGDHGLVQKGCRFYEGLVRVPLIWQWPRHINAGLRSPALVELIDVAPTLLEAAGITIPAAMQGRSLLPILSGKASSDHHRDSVRCEYLDSLALPEATRATMYYDGRHKLALYHSANTGELYDLENDPWEHDNLFETDLVNRERLTKASFDATIMAADGGSPRIAVY
jgi:arylsulfatase A-like enzyme